MLSNDKQIDFKNPPMQDNYDTAYSEAIEKLSGMDIDDVANKTGTSIEDTANQRSIIIPFLKDTLVVNHPEINIYYKNRNDDVPLWLKIILLHYCIYAKGTPSGGNQITFKQLEGGMSYYPVFQKRTIIPILKTFRNDLKEFCRAGEAIGGIISSQGDYAVTLRPFPMIELTFVVWDGGDEFPADGNVIFDSSISDYFTTEDIAVLANMIAVMMIKAPR